MAYRIDIKNFLIIIVILIMFLSGCKKEEVVLEDVKVVFEDKPKEIKEPEKEEIVYVSIHKFKFEPDVVNITIGGTVVWENVDDYPHFVRTTQSGFQTPILNPGEKFNLTFNTAHKTYKYVDPNFGMIGYINVKY